MDKANPITCGFAKVDSASARRSVFRYAELKARLQPCK
jgi:hypothetical protein